VTGNQTWFDVAAEYPTIVVVTAIPNLAHILAHFGQSGSFDADVHADMFVLVGRPSSMEF
ncbi:hypothetical protein OFM35_32270, partial [Escherichia coli]|nr:hypothetical protein [Escherichia coli]